MLKISGQLINHRAKRGGSLFQGGSGGEEGREATPSPCGGEERSPPIRGRSPLSCKGRSPLPLSCWGVRLRSSVFRVTFALNVNGFGRNLAGRDFGSSRIEWLRCFLNRPPGGRAIKHERRKNGRFGSFWGILRLLRPSTCVPALQEHN